MIPSWGIPALIALTVVYFLLALFRAAQLELPRLRLGSVLREAGRAGGLLERWSTHKHRTLLLLAVQLAFQAILVLATLLVADLIGRAFPLWPAPLKLVVAFLTTVILLVIAVRILLVRAIVYLAPETAVRIGGQIATLTALLFLPLLIPLDRLIRSLSARLGAETDMRSEESLEEDLHAFVTMGEEEGILEKEEGDLVRNVVDFGDTIVREIMTPRMEMVVLDRKALLGEVRQSFVSAKHSRIPVQRDSIDHIEGLLNIKDLLGVWCDPADTNIEHLVRPAMFVPETKKVLDLLREMQQAQVPFAVVVDEYGGTAGLVTVEDIVEEIVGEIQEEHEVVEEEIVEESPGTWLVSGFASVDDVAELLGLQINGMDVDTVGGLVTALLGRVPEAGETLEQGGVTMEVVAADGRRVHKIRMSHAGSRTSVEGKN